MGEISLHQVTYQASNKIIIDQVSVDFNQRQISCIIGPNGSGKSTLLQLIAGLIKPASGSIKIENTDLASFNKKTLAKKITYLPQQSRIPHTLTVYEYVLLGRYCHQSWLGQLTEEDHAATKQAIYLTNLASLAHTEAAKLSLGQQQRARLALTLAQGSPYILLDEPMTGLDLKQQYHLIDLLQKLKNMGKTIILILHDLHQVKTIADQVILLQNGCIKAEGLTDEVLQASLICEIFDCNDLRWHPAIQSLHHLAE